MRRFVLKRTEDVSGVSGTGTVAEGVELSNGKVCMQWLSSNSSLVIYDCIKEVETIHGHEGRTSVVFID
jgi:hypothetical protein